MEKYENLLDEKILELTSEDPSYFTVLVDKYKVPFLRKPLSVIRSKEEAEDIVQETFVKIYKYSDKFTKRKDIEFKSWAYKILMNTSFTHYQKVKKTSGNTEFLDPVLYDDLPGENNDLDVIQDAKAAVAETISKMPEHLGIVLKLYYIDYKSYADICKEVKISIPTLKMRLFRAKRLFKKLSVE